MRLRAECRGISLLEVLVALVLIGTVGLALMNWMQQNLDGSRRVGARAAEVSEQKDAIAWLLSQNYSAQPSGEARLGSLWLRWESELVEPARRNYAFDESGAPGPWAIALRKVEVEVRERRDGPLRDSFALIVHQREFQ